MVAQKIRVSLLQMDVGDDLGANQEKALSFLERALRDGPDVICLPETFLYYGRRVRAHALSMTDAPIRLFRDFAKAHTVNIVLGSLMLKKDQGRTLTNTSFVINRQGQIVHRYDKIYLYDVQRKDIMVRESSYTQQGQRLGIFQLDGRTMGLGICVDLRYPEYFRRLIKKGARVIFLPSSFRQKTGQLAWHVLTQARAIENQVYFCGCNQTGGRGDRQRCGQTRIVSYNGSMIKNIAVKEGIVTASLDFCEQEVFRREFPVLQKI